MEKEKIQEFTMRVTQASRTELIVILYDILLNDIKEASLQFEQNNEEAFIKELKHAQKCINQLMGSLDYTYDISRELLSLYSYVNKTVIAAIMKKEISGLASVTSVISKLKASFEEVSRQDMSGPMMENTQQVYAGLTYGKGTLNESLLGLNEPNRGFKA